MIFCGDKVLLARRHSRDKHGGQWEFPGGHIEEDEDAAAAAVRETREEVGLSITVTAELCEDVFRPNAYHQIHTTLFAAHVQDPSAVKADGHEVSEVAWFDFEDMPENMNRTSRRALLKMVS